MRFSILFFALVIFALTACEKESDMIAPIKIAPVKNQELKSHKATRPFKGTIFEVLLDEADIECDCEEVPIIGYSGGQGKMTHMGKVTSKAQVCIEEFVFDENGVYIETRVAGVCISLTAANGDEVFLAAGSHILRPDPDCACVTGEVIATITGGTGRFKDATGSADFFLSFDPVTGVYTEKYDGAISY